MEYHPNSTSMSVEITIDLFNHTFDCGLYPDTWCEDIVNPLYFNQNLPTHQRTIEKYQ